MAKEKRKPFDYEAVKQKLMDEGPAPLYMLRGEEDFLRDKYMDVLTGLCLGEDGDETFNHHRFRGPGLDMEAFRDAVEAMPFLGGRTLIEVRDFDVNKTAGYDPDVLRSILSDLPEWTTVVFLFAPGYNPDGKLKAVRLLREKGVDIEFSTPAQGHMIGFVREQAAACGKRIESRTIEHLLWICGSRMNTLVPEITKICGAAAGEEITEADIDAVAKRAPDTAVFKMADSLGARQYDRAAEQMADLLSDRDETPQKQLFWVGEIFRRLLVVKTAMECGKPDSYIQDCIPELNAMPFLLRNYKNACRNYSRERLAHAVRLCVECDFGMKDRGPDEEALMKELILRLALDRT